MNDAIPDRIDRLGRPKEPEAVNGIKHDPTNLVDFETGAHRSSASGKGRYDLIPTEATRRSAIHYEQGGINHGDRNWEKGMPFSRLMDSAMRHCNQYLGRDRSEDHLAAAVWNLMAVMHFEKYKPELNDLPVYNDPNKIELYPMAKTVTGKHWDSEKGLLVEN